MSARRPGPSCPTCKRGLPPQWPRKKVMTITGADKLEAVVAAARKVITSSRNADGLVVLVDVDAELDLDLALRRLDIAQGRVVDDREEMPF